MSQGSEVIGMEWKEIQSDPDFLDKTGQSVINYMNFTNNKTGRKQEEAQE